MGVVFVDVLANGQFTGAHLILGCFSEQFGVEHLIQGSALVILSVTQVLSSWFSYTLTFLPYFMFVDTDYIDVVIHSIHHHHSFRVMNSCYKMPVVHSGYCHYIIEVR
jgi:hypothetical protein